MSKVTYINLAGTNRVELMGYNVNYHLPPGLTEIRDESVGYVDIFVGEDYNNFYSVTWTNDCTVYVGTDGIEVQDQEAPVWFFWEGFGLALAVFSFLFVLRIVRGVTKHSEQI